MDFKEQIKSPKWQKKRLEILERDEYICQNCGDEENQLHVHHFVYYKGQNLWEYENDCLTTLCENCHGDWHSTYDEIKDFLCLDNVRLNEIRDLLDLIHCFNPFELMKLRKIAEELNKLR